MDLFAVPFVFRVRQHEKEKKTTLGTLLSVSVIALSLAYFVYLSYSFFAGNLNAKVTYLSLARPAKQVFKSSPIRINFETLEKDVNIEDYFTFEVRRSDITDANKWNNSTQWESAHMKPCEGPGFAFCLDTQNLTFMRAKSNFTVYFINLMKCTGRATCVSDAAISTIMTKGQWFLTVYYGVYDTRERHLVEATQEFSLFTDPDFVLIDDLQLNFNQLNIDNGFLFALNKSSVHTGGFVRTTSQVTNRYFQQFSNFMPEYRQTLSAKRTLMQTQLNLNWGFHQINVEYPKYSDVLAQFLSIFNVLLIVGMFASQWSEAQISEQLLNDHLRDYYAATALELYKHKALKSSGTYGESRVHAHDTDKYNNQTEGDSDTKVEKNKSSKVIDEFLKCEDKLVEQNFCDWLKSFVKSNSQNGGQSNINNLPARVQKEDLYDLLLSETTDRMNIYSLYREITKLQNAVHVLLSPEQYAALQVCGRRYMTVEQMNYLQMLQNAEKAKHGDTEGSELVPSLTLNHLEKMQAIDKSEDVRRVYLHRFVQKAKAQGASGLDARIVESLLSVGELERLKDEQSGALSNYRGNGKRLLNLPDQRKTDQDLFDTSVTPFSRNMSELGIRHATPSEMGVSENYEKQQLALKLRRRRQADN